MLRLVRSVGLPLVRKSSCQVSGPSQPAGRRAVGRAGGRSPHTLGLRQGISRSAYLVRRPVHFAKFRLKSIQFVFRLTIALKVKLVTCRHGTCGLPARLSRDQSLRIASFGFGNCGKNSNTDGPTYDPLQGRRARLGHFWTGHTFAQSH